MCVAAYMIAQGWEGAGGGGPQKCPLMGADFLPGMVQTPSH